MTPEDHLRLVGELVSVFGAVIILIIEVCCGRGPGVRLSAVGVQPEPQSARAFVSSWSLSRFQTSSAWGSLASLDRPSLEDRSTCCCEPPSSHPRPFPHQGCSFTPRIPNLWRTPEAPL